MPLSSMQLLEDNGKGIRDGSCGKLVVYSGAFLHVLGIHEAGSVIYRGIVQCDNDRRE